MSEPLVVVTSDDSSPAVVIAPVTASPSVIVTGEQGPPGPPGDSHLPDPATLANGRYITTLDGQYIDVPAPAGSGDMQSLIYDPRGIANDAFNISNLTGALDGGVFT